MTDGLPVRVAPETVGLADAAERVADGRAVAGEVPEAEEVTEGEPDTDGGAVLFCARAHDASNKAPHNRRRRGIMLIPPRVSRRLRSFFCYHACEQPAFGGFKTVPTFPSFMFIILVTPPRVLEPHVRAEPVRQLERESLSAAQLQSGAHSSPSPSSWRPKPWQRRWAAQTRCGTRLRARCWGCVLGIRSQCQFIGTTGPATLFPTLGGSLTSRRPSCGTRPRSCPCPPRARAGAAGRPGT